MSITIIFLDEKLKGYMEDENSAKRAVSDLADALIEELKTIPETRIFRENVEMGIKIYTQATGKWINGGVNLVHTISWKNLPQYEPKLNLETISE